MNRCEAIRRRLDDWLDDLLASAERSEVEAHVRDCADCRSVFERQAALARELHTLGRVADRMASGGQASSSVRSYGRFLVRAAVVFLVATIALSAWQLARSPVDQLVARGPDAPVVEERSIGRTVRPVGATSPARTFAVVPDRRRLAVQLESDNPRIHIVWFFDEIRSPETSNGDANDEVPATSI